MVDKKRQDYIARVISRYLKALHAHEASVGKKISVVTIHQLRVYSRRLSTSLDVFKAFLPKKRAKTWRNNVRSLTKHLSEMRDYDVQIEFLRKAKKFFKSNQAQEDINVLIRQLVHKRRKLQYSSLESIESFRKSRTIPSIRKELKDHAGKKASKLDKKVFIHSRKVLLKRVKAVESFKEYVYRSSCIEEHHQMRLAVKRLRYALEGFNELYDDRLTLFIDYFKRLQAHLGEMHDYDVWGGKLAKLSHAKGKDEVSKNTVTIFQSKVKEMKHKSYECFKITWSQGIKKQIQKRLIEVLGGD